MVDLAKELGFDPAELSGGANTRGHQLRMASLRRDARLREETFGEPAAAEEPLVVMNQAQGAPMAMLSGMIPGGFTPPQPTAAGATPAEIAHTSVVPAASQVPVAVQRVAVYVARGDMLSIAVERAPEWDTEEQWKLDDATIVAILPILRCLGVKVQDKTGGDLADLERSYELGQRHQEADSWSLPPTAASAHPPTDQQARSGAAAAPRRRNARKRSDPPG